ncbi:MAG: tetratricopeptide repeat protein [Ignavibacteriae bacterium]|nr:tetratricopeptide repeat protein [Ignavibacteriota bacterium]
MDRFVLGILILLVGFTAFAQSPEATTKFRLAQGYEQGGDYENAIKLYRELHFADPDNIVYFDSLRRTYLLLKRYDEVITLLQNRLIGRPTDVNLIGSLGGALYQSGREKEATATWERAIAVDPANAGAYRVIANVLIENRLLDRTAELYRQARVACSDPNLFTLDLAQVLAVSMDYAGATREYVRWLKQNPGQLGLVQSRMSTFTGKEEARAASLEELRTELKRADDLNMYRLMGWLYLEGKDFDQGFEVYKTIDKLSSAQGGELYAFAERAYKEQAFEVAAKAYRAAIATPVSSPRMPYAKYGYASALKELSILSDTLQEFAPPSGDRTLAEGPVGETQARYAGAIDYFRQIIQEYPNTEFSAKSYYQIGAIQLVKFFDLDAALTSFESVGRDLPGKTPVHFAVGIKIGEVLTAKGDIEQAALRFQSVINAPNATPDQQDEASYRQAELHYFNGKFNEAIDLLEGISNNLKADFTNDALLLHSFLQENRTTSEAALKEFARADFVARQRKNAEAIAIFSRLIEQYPHALLVDDALMKVAVLQTYTRRYMDAISSYERLLTEFKESSIALDKAQFNIAELYAFRMSDNVRAIAAYEKLLADYPQSILAAIARKRIRELRGDSL